MDLICIVLGSDTKKDRTKDSIELIEYAFKNFEMVNIKEKVLAEFENWKLCNSSSFVVNKGVSNNVDVVLDNLPFDFFPITRNHIDSVSIYIYCANTLEAPLDTNSNVGYLTVSIDNKTILTLNINNSNYIPKKNCLDFWNNMLKNYTYHLETLFYNV